MKTIFALPLVLAFGIFSSCQKQQTDAERQAEIDREVQRRVEAEHQAQEREQLAQRETEVDAREKALAEKQSAAARNREPVTPSARTEQRVTRAEAPQATASYETFYTKLEPQGVWRETSTYGYVWQPREAQASRGWRPYTNGHWVYTEAGWTWISEEPFGWATYHYGRWARLRNIGWVWIPGDEWAPAWVSWRKSDDYIGWAPLPPEARFDRASGIHNWADSYYDIGPDQYCFVPTHELGAQRIERVIVPPERNVTIVNQTTNVTNITYSNTMIVNQGPNYDELRSRMQQPIARLRLERQTSFNVENPRAVVKGEVIEVPAPVIPRAQRVERPRSVKETLTQAVVDHGWEGITDRQAAEKVRVKIRSEATPPPNAPPRTFVKPAQVNVEAATSLSPSAPPSVAPVPVATEAASPSPSVPTASPPAPAASTPPFRQPRPLESVSPAASARPQLGNTPRVNPSETVTPMPTPAFSPTERSMESRMATPPRRSPAPLDTTRGGAKPTASVPASPPEASPTVSASPSTSPPISGSTPGSAGIGPDARNRDQRPTKELRKQEKILEKQQKKERDEQGPTRTVETPASATPTAATTSPLPSPEATGSPFLYDARKPRKESEKLQKRDREGTSEPTASVSPSPSVPQ